VGGFTLIELLVVLVIIGSLVSFAVLVLGNSGGTRELRSEADRLATVLGLLLEEATLDNREYGLQIGTQGYRVLVYDDLRASWSQHPDSRSYQLPEWMQLKLTLDGEPLQLPAPEAREASADESADAAEQAKLQPQILALSSGEWSPFTLQLSDRRPGGQRYQLTSDGFNLPPATQVQP
jgi:general secretion pathway protein H